MSPAVRPGTPAGGALVYDAESGRFVWHGGMLAITHDKFRALKETWAYDASSDTWTQQAPGPPGGLFHQMAYDAESDRVILFGGLIPHKPHDRTFYNDLMLGEKLDGTWAYDLNTDTWTEMEPTESPPARCCFPMAYDAESDRVIIYSASGDAAHLARCDLLAFTNNTHYKRESCPSPAAC
jgi:hypothetical protein